MKYLMACLLLCSTALLTADETEKLHKVTFSVEIEAPSSEELQHLISVIPVQDDNENHSFEDWSKDCTANMQAIISLIESGNVRNSVFSVKIDD